MVKERFCANCNKKVKRIRTTNQNLHFCSGDCRDKYQKKMLALIKNKEIELNKLKENYENLESSQ